MNFISICPYVRFANIFPTVIDGVSLRKAYDCRLFYFLQSGIFYTETAKYNVVPGSVIYIPAGTAYCTEGAPTCAVRSKTKRATRLLSAKYGRTHATR